MQNSRIDSRRTARPQSGSTTQTLVTKNDVEKAERMVVEAVQMVDTAMSRHAAKRLEKENTALKDICESTKFKARVEAFQKDTASAMLKANKLHR
jgi:hypothetical protein